MRTIFLIILSIVFFKSNSEDRYRFDNECGIDNSLILAEVIYEIDSSFIQKMLNENCKLFLIAHLDTSGFVSKIESTPYGDAISQLFLDEIKDYINSNNIQFYYCYNNDGGRMKKKPQRVPWITLSIPGGLYQRKIIQYLKERKIIRKEDS
jgi:hypothetical protein